MRPESSKQNVFASTTDGRQHEDYMEARSRRAPAVEKGPSRQARPLRKPPLDAQRPSPPDAQLLFPHVDINLLTVIAHIEQLQFDIATWVT